ncbi:uncharacterized protein [Oscarella lobularis]|uniref:uncharacterized protein n=1 Tax=Oscarella lobularis TaxID=121494 RepID=UPI003313A3DD
MNSYFCSLLLVLLLHCAVALDNGVALTPPLGWDTWCTQGPCGRDWCSAEEVQSAADELVANGMQAAGYQYVIISDCWADTRDPHNSSLTADKTRFPNGIKPVCDYIHKKGLKCGIYTDLGTNTCSKGGRDHAIPGSYGHYKQDAQTFADWGIDFVKADFCNTIKGDNDPHKLYKEFSDALNATGRPILFNSCEWGLDKPWEWMAPIANTWRTGHDHADEWSNTASVIEINANLASYAGPGAWNDADFIMVGGEGCTDFAVGHRCPGQTDTEYRTSFSLWVIMASQIIVATEIRNMSAFQKEVLLNKELLAVHQDRLRKAGQRVGFANCSQSKVCQIWARNVTSGVAVALYNSDKVAHDITFSFATVGIHKTPVAIRDLWAHTDLGHFSGTSYTGKAIPSHGTNMYLLSMPETVTNY